MARVEPEALSRPFERTCRRTRPETRVCDHPGCTEEGQYRAPRARDRLDEYYWFCLAHVRDYNRAWDYFAGMSEAEIEAERRRDSTWQRPSWRIGSLGGGFRAGPHGFRDDFGFFSEEQEDAAHTRRAWEENRRREANGQRQATPEARALATLDLEPPVSFDAIKARYKYLVKRLHPDANGGDTSQEDKLKDINQAYATLRAAYAR